MKAREMVAPTIGRLQISKTWTKHCVRPKECALNTAKLAKTLRPTSRAIETITHVAMIFSRTPNT